MKAMIAGIICGFALPLVVLFSMPVVFRLLEEWTRWVNANL